MEIVEDAISGASGISSVFPHEDTEKVTVGEDTSSGSGGGVEDDTE